VYDKVVARYPTPAKLAAAPPEQVANDLKSLGLRWRIAQFQRTAAELVQRFDGEVPCDRDSLTSLTGVSDYVADAVLVFGCNEPRAVIDANVARIIARHFGYREHAEARRDPKIRQVADALLPPRRAREYNFAMLDLAALVCTPTSPKHDLCPLRRTCARAAADDL
jgi:A/G-specific adenine glycosylase